MTKSELRKARKEAHAAGRPLTGVLALPSKKPVLVEMIDELNGAPQAVQNAMLELVRKSSLRATRSTNRRATRSEQHARYIDAGPRNWDDC